jgi:GTPase Era involved in 16S rRNA processing
MKIADDPRLAGALRSAAAAVSVIRRAGHDDLAASLEQAVAGVQAERFVIGVVGATKRGKSTLVNGLLGRRTDDCAPIGRKPATSVISIFGHGPSAECRVYFEGGEHRVISEAEIRLYATEEHNRGNHKKVRSIECMAPFAGLEPGMVLVDTPGAGNALEQMHNEILLGFLPNADAVVFLVTAEEPLTQGEMSLLGAVRAKDVRKIFFAVNMVDRVESGDLTPDALAEGINHNRAAVASLESRAGGKAFSAAKFYTISAKRFHETRHDPGTEELIHDITTSIRRDRLSIVSQKLRDRVTSTLEECERRVGQQLREATASREDLLLEIEQLATTRQQVGRGRAARESEFRREWSAAFDDLADGLAVVRRALHSDYAARIDAASPFKLGGLASTIHADVAASFSELLAPHVGKCETRIGEAQRKLLEQTFATVVDVSPQLHTRVRASSAAKASIEAGISSLPSLVTGTVVANLPGWVGGMIAASAPTVATAVWWNPATWAAAAATGMANAAVHGTAAAVGTTLAVIATPVSILAFGISAYRLVATWKSQQDKNKNQLALSVRELIEDAHHQVQRQLEVYRAQDLKLLADYQAAVEVELTRIEGSLKHALERKPDDNLIRALQDKQALLADHRAGLPGNLSSEAPPPGGADERPFAERLTAGQ